MSAHLCLSKVSDLGLRKKAGGIGRKCELAFVLTAGSGLIAMMEASIGPTLDCGTHRKIATLREGAEDQPPVDRTGKEPLMANTPQHCVQSHSTVPPHEPTPCDDERFRSGTPFIVTPQAPGVMAAFALMIAFAVAFQARPAHALGPLIGQLSSVAGSVSLTDADGATFAAAGVRLILKCASEPLPRFEISDEAGAFRFERVPGIGCAISTDLQGFRSDTAAVEPPHTTHLRFHLEVVPAAASVTVTGGASANDGVGEDRVLRRRALPVRGKTGT
jgi:hypothetical protein